MTGFTWREFARQIAKHGEILGQFQAKQVPSYGSIYVAWQEIPESKLVRLIGKLGKQLCKSPKKAAADSTGVVFKGGAVGVLLRWSKSKLKKTSKAFRKVHIVVSSCCQAILAAHVSKTTKPDIRVFPVLLNLLGKKLLRNLNKISGDKGLQVNFIKMNFGKSFRFVWLLSRNETRCRVKPGFSRFGALSSFAGIVEIKLGFFCQNLR